MSSSHSDAPSPAAPLEIQFLILDEIKSNDELRRLAFICSAWAEHVQSILFRKIHVNHSSNAQRFLSVLHANSRLGRYTRRLSMKPGDGIFTYTDLQPFLSDLRTIHTSGPIPGPLPHPPRPWVAVRKLAMEFCSLPTTIDIWELIALFPALRCLEFSGAGTLFNHEPTSAIAVHTPVVQLKHLAVLSSRYSSTQPFIPHLCRRDMVVDRLTVALGTKDRDASQFNHLLSKIGPTLQHLEVVELPKYLAPVVGICVEPCTALRTLGLLLRFSTASAENMRSGLLPILRQTASPTLTALMLKVSLAAPLLDLPWEEIDGILSGGLYSGLQRITIKFLPTTTRLTMIPIFS